MDKQKEKTLVTEAEKFIQQLLDENKLDVKKVEILSKKLQKLNSSSSKKREENKKDLSDYLNDKNEVKAFLEKNESNYTILVKACQKILSKSQPQPAPDTSDNKKEAKNTQSAFKVEKKDLIEIFNKKGEDNFKDNCEKLFIYFEYLSQFKIEESSVPVFTMTFFPKEKKINFFLKCKEKMNLNFSQVDYLCNYSKECFLNIDYFSIMGNCEVEKTREYKENFIDMGQFEKLINDIPVVKGNDFKIISIGDDLKKLKKELKDYCYSIKDKIKSIVTNNKESFNEIII